MRLETIWQDVRYSLRTMRRAPGFTLVAVLSLALGIGANTAIFTLIDDVMLRMLPVHQPEQLVELLNKYPGEPRGNFFSRESYEYYRDHNHVFSGVIATAASHFSVRYAGAEPEMLDSEFVVGGFFPVLGVKPAIGRLIAPDDDRSGAASSAVAVVSWSYWKNRFNLDPSILGRQIVVEDVPLTIVGVAPRAFFGLQVGSRPDLWMPLAVESIIDRPSRISGGGLHLMARLRPGVSFEQARAEMTVLYRFTIDERSQNSRNPLMRQLRFEMEPAGAGFSLLRDRFEKPLLLLMAIVGLLLLIACANVASMLLARGAARRREMAVRVSLGARPFRLVRLVLTESLLLSAAGSLLGVLLAYFGAGALLRILTSGRQIVGAPSRISMDLHPDLRVLLFTIGIALATGVLFALMPAWSAFTTAPAGSLRQAGENNLGRLFGKSLVVAQVAFSVVLISAAGLFISHLSNLENLDLGFRRDHVLLVTLDPARSGFPREQLAGFYQEVLTRLEVIPGVRSATLCAPTPLSGAGATRFAAVEGFQEAPEARRYLSLSWIGPDYFETLGTPLLAGRDFRPQDQGGPRVAIINEAMARYYFANRDPIGKHVTLDGSDQPYEIVGVVGNANYYEIREPALRTMFLDASQFPGSASNFALRTSLDPTAIAPGVRRIVRESLKTIPVTRITTLTDQIDASIVPERLIATLSGSFGLLGSLLVAIGIYGLLAYTVARRTNEIGIRMALGATPGNVTRMVLSDALAMASIGLLLGAPIALWAKKFAASVIDGLSIPSVVPIAIGSAAIVVLALLAAFIPARRAARVDPLEALRQE